MSQAGNKPEILTEHTVGVHGDLTGFTIGVTADRRSDEQIEMLEGRGAICLHGPALETHPLVPEVEIRAASEKLIAEPPDITIFTTGIGVRGWFSSADTQLFGEEVREAIASSQIFARGPKARGAAITAGLDVEPEKLMSFDDILSLLRARNVAGLRIALQLDGDPEPSIVDSIEELGAEVVAVPVYRWTEPTNRGALVRLVNAVADHEIDALTFTARPAVENFVRAAQVEERFGEVCQATYWHTKVICVGERTAAAVEAAGMGTPSFPKKPLLGTMVRHLTEEMQRAATELDLAGHRVILRGHELRVGVGEQQTLTRRERRLFTILLSRPGIVFSKSNLLSEVWKGDAHDEHVVEVTVGRLRKRLGEASDAIETVTRRGYRVRAA